MKERRGLLLAGACLWLQGCGGAALTSRADATREIIAKAREMGAESCAPIALAMAESHEDFARQELSEGNYFRARREVEVAETHADEALSKARDGGCGSADSDGDGIPDASDACPTQPEDGIGAAPADGCPDSDNDSDGDGVVDAADRCPEEPEDRDGHLDDDGCPDVDNDGDGILDASDRCPDAAEDIDEFEDEDGCPDCDNDGDGVPECPQAVDKCPLEPAKTADGCPKAYKNVVVTDDKIEIKQTIYFATGKATIKPVSHALLDEVAEALSDNPTIEIRIEGHTDSRGKDAYNLALSQSRAEAVREYLIGKNIEEARLVAEGFGERMPIADNRTNAGREQNRRVEFVITGR